VRRWLIPLSSALAVLAVLGAVWAYGARGPSSGTAGPEPGRPSSGPSYSPASPAPVRPLPGGNGPGGILDPRSAALYGWTSSGRTLTVYFATGVPSCSGKPAAPRVLETESAVTVTVRLTPPPRRARQLMCPDLAMLRHLDVHLALPLAGRAVLDGGRGGAPVAHGAPLQQGLTPTR